jgi:glycosyltransferase involved in cell wall biosynthesis
MSERIQPSLLSINNFHYRRAGSDALFMDHDRLFRARGWATAVFSMQHAGNEPSVWDRYFVEELEFSRSYSFAERLRLAGKVMYSFEARAKLRRLLAEFTPDIAHVHSVYHHISPAILPVLHAHGIPIVLTAHDYKLACPAYKMFDGQNICEDCNGGKLMPLIRKRCLHGSTAIGTLVAAESAMHRALGSYRYVQQIVCPSLFMRGKLIEWGWPAERLVHVRNFFDATLWQPQYEPGDYFLYFGRLAPEKGLLTLLQAASLARVPLKIAGSGTMRSQLTQLAQRLALQIEFIPHAAIEQLSALIAGARATVLPSEWYENSSLAILESMACGKPVIASSMGGNPEAVLPERNGWLFAARDVEALADRLRTVAVMPAAKLADIGRQAREFVSAEYGGDAYFETMKALYASVNSRERSSTDRHAIAAMESVDAC